MLQELQPKLQIKQIINTLPSLERESGTQSATFSRFFQYIGKIGGVDNKIWMPL